MDVCIGSAEDDPVIAGQQIIALQKIAAGFDEKIDRQQHGKMAGRRAAERRQTGLLIIDVAAHKVDANSDGAAQKNNQQRPIF